MAKITIDDLKKIKEKVHKEMSLRDGDRRVKVTVHMGTCGIASGAKEVMDTLLEEIEAAKAQDVIVTTSGCMGLCSREPLVTVEVLNAEPIKYEYVNPNKMRQIFKRHILAGEIQTPFVLAKGSEVLK
ncbi:MAG TPA: (2Fe-2S) ferredoxin domain-containing protein [Smithellaceae bacterium]|jgi:NADP-reducing hydrogenase subunit HndB|nr:(2Fe-2S) ferredoxin domain-containing protein [Syntrophaceae bacterium]NMC90287.1 (2Fe-2S) ferredoxin domain-containing protein [Smithella sp.]OQC71219.1 MAG: NADP-reducing hydrogenase subunit HndB [Deltaproteobacteria bacterium ADurb.Bin002]HNV56042.1 (2Fe-2S) ferredoxin domain-containing protein [Smithellaceae bacterium]MBP8665411.1 (2Fe-2S) ferredoxin domain-containing protein [Syntrophaceae bacterium]